jgi:hypothetical protein
MPYASCQNLPSCLLADIHYAKQNRHGVVWTYVNAERTAYAEADEPGAVAVNGSYWGRYQEATLVEVAFSSFVEPGSVDCPMCTEARGQVDGPFEGTEAEIKAKLHLHFQGFHQVNQCRYQCGGFYAGHAGAHDCPQKQAALQLRYVARGGVPRRRRRVAEVAVEEAAVAVVAAAAVRPEAIRPDQTQAEKEAAQLKMQVFVTAQIDKMNAEVTPLIHEKILLNQGKRRCLQREVDLMGMGGVVFVPGENDAPLQPQPPPPQAPQPGVPPPAPAPGEAHARYDGIGFQPNEDVEG